MVIVENQKVKQFKNERLLLMAELTYNITVYINHLWFTIGKRLLNTSDKRCELSMREILLDTAPLPDRFDTWLN